TRGRVLTKGDRLRRATVGLDRKLLAESAASGDDVVQDALRTAVGGEARVVRVVGGCVGQAESNRRIAARNGEIDVRGLRFQVELAASGGDVDISVDRAVALQLDRNRREIIRTGERDDLRLRTIAIVLVDGNGEVLAVGQVGRVEFRQRHVAVV